MDKLSFDFPAGQQVGNVLRMMREEVGLTQESLGGELGISQGRLTQIENGNWGKVFQMLSAICKRCGYTVTLTFTPMGRK